MIARPDGGSPEADVLVVGGGPAGSTVATLLARRGWKVVLLDRARFPRPKACGECINPGGVALLRRLGLFAAVRALPTSRIEGWELVTEHGDRASGRFGPEVSAGLAVARERLDHALLLVARGEGVRVEEGVTVRAAHPAGPDGMHSGPGPARGGSSDRAAHSAPRVHVVERDGTRSVRSARIVVGADGLQSIVARSLGSPTRPPCIRKVSLTARLRTVAGPTPDRPTPESATASAAPGSGSDPPPRSTHRRLPRASGRLVLTDEGTLGLAPVGAGGWNATVVVDAADQGREIASDPEAFLRTRLDRHVDGWSDGVAVVGGPWASGPFDRPRKRIAGGGIVLVGDAAGYFDPLTGQGIFRALRSAELAATSIDTALRRGRPSGAPFARYARAVDDAFSPGRRLQRVIEGVVERGWSRRLAVSRLGRVPAALGALIRVTGDARPCSTLLGVPTLRALTFGR